MRPETLNGAELRHEPAALLRAMQEFQRAAKD